MLGNGGSGRSGQNEGPKVVLSPGRESSGELSHLWTPGPYLRKVWFNWFGVQFGHWESHTPREIGTCSQDLNAGRRASAWQEAVQEVEWTEAKGRGMVPNTTTLPFPL